MKEIIPLTIFAFIAGFIDSIAGGGGLIQLPALLVLCPNYSLPLIFGTNKFSSIWGTLLASYKYSRHLKIKISLILPPAIAGFVFSFIGAKAVSILSKEYLQPVIIFLLIIVAIYTFIKKDFGKLNIQKKSPKDEKIIIFLSGVIIGFYDGFFGPGTGSFLIFIFVTLLGYDFITSSTSAKIINLFTNLSAVLFFAFSSNIKYDIAIPMAISNATGSFFGSRLAVLKGNSFIRIFFLIIISALIIKLLIDTIINRYNY